MPKDKQFPNVYKKVYNPDPEQSFISKAISKQSNIIDNETGTRLSALSTSYTSELRNLHSVHNIFEHGLSISSSSPCLGSRETTKSPYSWLTYKQVEEKIIAFGSALSATLGYADNQDNFVGIYARNSPAWVITQQACAAYSYVYVPIYDTLGKEALLHILDQTQLKFLLCHSVREAQYVLKDLQIPLDYVVIVTECEEATKLRSEYASKTKLFYFDEFLEMGSKNPHPKKLPDTTALCTLCYTSGSTGIPKGVMLTHDQYVDAVLAAANTLEGKYTHPVTVHLSYLPLAHILEQLVSSVMFLSGARVAYLTSGLNSILADLRAVKPTILAAVPRVLNRFHKEFMKKIPKWQCIRKLIQRCIDKKLAEQATGKFKHNSFIDCLFFSPFRKVFGGNLCGIVSGGAPLVPDVNRFYRGVLGCPVVQGYGSSETMGILAFGLIGDPEVDVTGAPATGVELKLADVPDMGIIVSRDGVGEVCARGLRCTKGYYEDPQATANLIDADGWLHTGDVGTWTDTGALKIVDRCKNMFKLARGEYVAPEKVEAIYLCSPLILFILVDGEPTATHAVAVVHPDFQQLRTDLTSHDVLHLKESEAMGQALSDKELSEHPAVRRFLLSKMNALAKQCGLSDAETVRAIHITPEPFTIDNGLLTPVMKVARYKARKVFQHHIANLYDQRELSS